MAETKDRQFIDSVARSFAILECMSRTQRPMGNGEIARFVSLPPSSVSRLLYTLCELGYVKRSASERTYELTPKNLTLGYPLLAGLSLLDRARPYLKSLSETTGETLALAIRDSLHVTFVEVYQGTNLLAVRLATGGRLRMAVSASGIALAATLSERKRWSILNRLRVDMQKRNEDPTLFENALYDCLAHGIAFIRDVWQPGIGGIAVPVAWQGKVASLTMPIATSSVSSQQMQKELAPLMLEAGKEIGLASLPG